MCLKDWLTTIRDKLTVEKPPAITPEENQIKDLKKQLNKIKTIFDNYITFEDIVHETCSTYSTISEKLSRKQSLAEEYDTVFDYLHSTGLSVNGRILLMSDKTENISGALDAFYYSETMKSYYQNISLSRLSTDKIIIFRGHRSWYDYQKAFNLFIPYLYFFLSYLEDHLDNDDYQFIILDALMEHKDVLSLIARLIQLSDDEEITDLFFGFDEKANSQVVPMFNCFKAFVESVDEEVKILRNHQLHLRDMEERRKQLEIEEKLNYYTKDSLDIDLDKADDRIKPLLNKARDLSENKTGTDNN